MKKKALIGLALMLCCFIGGGSYIVVSIFNITDKLERVVSFHRVEFLREKLVYHVNAAQSDLLLQGSVHARNVEISIKYVDAIESSSDICFSCHHSDETTNRLIDLQGEVGKYMTMISRAMTIRANPDRVESVRSQAFSQGEQVLAHVKALSIASADKIDRRINTVRNDIYATNFFLIVCLVLGPLAILTITIIFLKRFTGSVDTLVKAAKSLQAGDLSYTIETPLRDEFHTLAQAFNRMVESLNNERQKFQSVNALYQTLFESAGDAIMITSLQSDSKGKIFSANPAAANMYGYSTDELRGMNILDLVPDDIVEPFEQQIETVLDGKWSRTRQQRKRRDGSFIPVDISLGLLQMDEQKYLLTFCKDISASLRAEEELQRANQMALVGQMAAGLAHEIKNPLAGVKVSLDVLADELELTADDKELFARIINEVNRMERLLKSLLNYARPPQPHFDRVDINRLLDNSIKNISVTTADGSDKKIAFTTLFCRDLEAIDADPSQLQQVFLNIYINAIDAMPQGGTITTLTRLTDDGAVVIRVSDQGEGMTAAAREKVFTPFFTTKSKGTGLGLAICKRLVEQHGGNIEVTSRLGEGTSFTITIPRAQNR